MATFAYSGRTRAGENVTGERAAETIDAAVAALRRERIVVTRITPAKARGEAGARKGGRLGKKVNLKAFMMDQHVVAGLGNIYVSEALFQAGLSPDRAAATLANSRGGPTSKSEKLVDAIKSVLESAIKAGGSTLRDYRNANGKKGAFQQRFAVYGRAGRIVGALAVDMPRALDAYAAMIADRASFPPVLNAPDGPDPVRVLDLRSSPGDSNSLVLQQVSQR